MEREDYMRAALALAHAAAADGEVPVGCVIADGAGRIIGRGRNRRERANAPGRRPRRDGGHRRGMPRARHMAA